MTPTLLHIGAQRLHLPTLAWAHEAGLRVLATDADPAAPARSRADAFAALDPEDADGHLRWIEGLPNGRGAAHVAGVLAADRRGLRTAARVAEALDLAAPRPGAVARALDPAAARRVLRDAGLQPVEDTARGDGPETRRFTVHGLFRDDAYVPGGVLEVLLDDDGHPRHAREGPLERSLEVALHTTVERAARALDLAAGPVGASLLLDGAGPRPVRLLPLFADPVMATRVTPHALGKSPLQAWFAALLGAGGPFDSMPARARRWAGWWALDPRADGAPERVERALALPGILGLCRWTADDDGEAAATPTAFLYAEAGEPARLAARLRAAQQCLAGEAGAVSAA